MGESDLLMVYASGPDRPGILAAFAKILQKHDMTIADIQQASLNHRVGLHLLLKFPDPFRTEDILVKDLLYEGHRHHLTLNVERVSGDRPPSATCGRMMVLTCFGGTRTIAALSGVLAAADANIERISSQTHHAARSFEMAVCMENVREKGRLKQRLMAESRRLGADLAVQSMTAYRKNKRMICFDMDSTLVDAEGIDEMARHAGVHREVARITEKAMRGDFDFEASLRQRVAMCKGLSTDALATIRKQMTLSAGAEALLTTLKWLGFKLGIVSGGFDVFADDLKTRFDLDFAYANRLEIRNGSLTGKVRGDILDDVQKARIVNRLSCDLGIPLDQVVAVGDGANDSLMLSQVGLGIAYNAKKGLERVAGAALSESRFHHIYHLLGITQEDITEAATCKIR